MSHNFLYSISPGNKNSNDFDDSAIISGELWTRQELRSIRASFDETQSEIREKTLLRDAEVLKGNGMSVLHLSEDIGRLHEVRCKLLDCQLQYCKLLEQQLSRTAPVDAFNRSAAASVESLAAACGFEAIGGDNVYQGTDSNQCLSVSNSLQSSAGAKFKTASMIGSATATATTSAAELLLHLSPDMLNALLCEWLRLPEVCHLDTALCNRSLRSEFLAALRSETLLFKGLSDSDYQEELAELNEWGEADAVNTLDLPRYLRWLNRRKVAVSRIKICSSMKHTSILKIPTGDEADGVLQLRDDISGHGGNLRWSPLALLTPFNCTSLQELIIEGPLSLNDTQFVEFISHCTRLQVASFDFQSRVASSFHSAPASPVPEQFHHLFQSLNRPAVAPGLADIAYMRMIYSCPQLTTLVVKGDTRVTGTMLKHIHAATVPRFKALHICSCSSILPASLAQFLAAANATTTAATSAVPLQSFQLDNCPSLLGDEEAAALGAVFGSSLRLLSLSKCERLSDDGAQQMLLQFCVLEVIEITDCRRLTDATIATIANAPQLQQSLKTLRIDGSVHITADSLRVSVSQLEKLEDLSIINCNRVISIAETAIVEDTRTIQKRLTHSHSHCHKRCTTSSICNLATDTAIANTTPTVVAVTAAELVGEEPQEQSHEAPTGIDSQLTFAADSVPDSVTEPTSYTSLSSVFIPLSSSSCAISATAQWQLLQLRALDFSHCIDLEDSVIYYAMAMCPRLRVLNLDLCESITDAALQCIGSGCPELDTLNLCACVNVTSEGVLSAVRLCKQLSVLDVSMCSRLSDAFITGLAVAAPQRLVYLGLMSCGISEHCMEDLFLLLHRSRSLRKLGFESTDRIFSQGATILQAMFPDLDIN